MAYYTFSQGFRQASTDPRCLQGGSLFQLGLKSEILNHRLLVNASAYLMRWQDVQSLAFGPAGSSGGLNP